MEYPLDLSKWVRLGDAWETFSELGLSDLQYRDQLRRLRASGKQESIGETRARIEGLLQLQSGLQHQFLGRLYDGEFDAEGVDITHALGSSRQALPHALFDPRQSDLLVVWDEDWLKAFGRKIIGIQIRPGAKLLQSLAAKEGVSRDSTDGWPRAPGAKSYEDIREAALTHLYSTVSGFDRLTIDRKLELLAEHVGDDLALRGFGRSSFYKARKKLIDTGKISSRNVQ